MCKQTFVARQPAADGMVAPDSVYFLYLTLTPKLLRYIHPNCSQSICEGALVACIALSWHTLLCRGRHCPKEGVSQHDKVGAGTSYGLCHVGPVCPARKESPWSRSESKQPTPLKHERMCMCSSVFCFRFRKVRFRPIPDCRSFATPETGARRRFWSEFEFCALSLQGHVRSNRCRFGKGRFWTNNPSKQKHRCAVLPAYYCDAITLVICQHAHGHDSVLFTTRAGQRRPVCGGG